MKIYMASPLGFSEAGRAFYNGTFDSRGHPSRF